LVFDPAGTVTFRGEGLASAMVPMPELRTETHVEIYIGRNHAYFAGLEAETVWFVRTLVGDIVEALRLDRLDLRDHYDPGGLRYVSFHELPGGDVVIVYELGLARLDANGRVCWHRVHDQLTLQLARITASVAWFRDEDGDIAFGLDDGREDRKAGHG
jgi:hypothetical protein